MKFSEKIVTLRKQKGWSQEELAQKLSVTRQTVSKWELDQTVPDMNKLIEISKLFEISVDELISEDNINNYKKEYKESTLEKNNRNISLKIFFIGLIVAIILCIIGGVLQINANKTNEKRYNEAYNTSVENVEKAKNRVAEIDVSIVDLSSQITSLETEISTLTNELTNIFIEDRGFSDRYNQKNIEKKEKDSKVTTLRSSLNELNTEKFKLQNSDYTVYYNKVSPLKYMVLYFIALGIFVVATLIALIYFLVTRRKK